MLTMRDVLVEEERRRDEMHKAAYGRLVRQAIPVNKFKCLLYIRLENILVRTGQRLQTRYEIPSYHTAASDLQTLSR